MLRIIAMVFEYVLLFRRYPFSESKVLLLQFLHFYFKESVYTSLFSGYCCVSRLLAAGFIYISKAVKREREREKRENQGFRTKQRELISLYSRLFHMRKIYSYLRTCADWTIELTDNWHGISLCLPPGSLLAAASSNHSFSTFSTI